MLKCYDASMAKSVNPDQTAPIGAYILNSSVILGNYLQQMTSADNIFRSIFFFLALLWLKQFT